VTSPAGRGVSGEGVFTIITMFPISELDMCRLTELSFLSAVPLTYRVVYITKFYIIL